METKTDKEINKNLHKYALITFQRESDEDTFQDFGNRGTFEPISNNIESLREKMEALIEESCEEWDERDYTYTCYYTIYGLPDDSPALEDTKDDTPHASPKYFEHWEVISEESFDIHL